jgi:hypothetical protein
METLLTIVVFGLRDCALWCYLKFSTMNVKIRNNKYTTNKFIIHLYLIKFIIMQNWNLKFSLEEYQPYTQVN